MTLIATLPFGLIMLLLCSCLWKALKIDHLFHHSKFTHGSMAWDGSQWKDRLGKILTFSKKKDAKTFLTDAHRRIF